MNADVKDYITLGLASVGAVLGVMNTWNTMSQRRIRIRVRPHAVFHEDGSPVGYSIEVINLSAFPVTLAEVGFKASQGRHVPLRNPHFLDNASLPRRLESREAVSAMFGPIDFPIPTVRLGDAYARLACGTVVRGNSPAGRQFGQMMAEVSKSRGEIGQSGGAP